MKSVGGYFDLRLGAGDDVFELKDTDYTNGMFTSTTKIYFDGVNHGDGFDKLIYGNNGNNLASGTNKNHVKFDLKQIEGLDQIIDKSEREFTVNLSESDFDNNKNGYDNKFFVDGTNKTNVNLSGDFSKTESKNMTGDGTNGNGTAGVEYHAYSDASGFTIYIEQGVHTTIL